jgi:glucokinase
MAQNYIVADVGGTHIRVACFPTQSHTPSIVKRIPTHGPDSPHERLINLIAAVAPRDDEIAAITVAAPGPLDPYEGIIFEAPNIPSWCNLPLRKLIQERFTVPVEIATMPTWQRLPSGALVRKGHHHLVYITVSTDWWRRIIDDDRLPLGSEAWRLNWVISPSWQADTLRLRWAWSCRIAQLRPCNFPLGRTRIIEGIPSSLSNANR